MNTRTKSTPLLALFHLFMGMWIRISGARYRLRKTGGRFAACHGNCTSGARAAEFPCGQ